MVRRVPWNTDAIDHRRRIVDSSDDDVNDAPAILSRAFDVLNCVEHVHQLSRAQRDWILRTVETDVEIARDRILARDSILKWVRSGIFSQLSDLRTGVI